MDFRLFIDEVGNSDLRGAATNENVRYLSLTGVLAPKEHHERIITPALNEVKRVIQPVYTGKPLVLHRREIVRREGVFAALRDDEIASEFNNKLLNLLMNSPYLAITVQIDKFEHLKKYNEWHFDPYHYCLRCLVERYILYLRRHNMRGDVVIEPRYKNVDKKVKASFERIYNTGTEHIPARQAQKFLTSKDIKFFDKTANISGLQLADLIAHPSARKMRFDRNGISHPHDFGTEICKILVEKRYARHPETHVIDGWGTKWLP